MAASTKRGFSQQHSELAFDYSDKNQRGASFRPTSEMACSLPFFSAVETASIVEESYTCGVHKTARAGTIPLFRKMRKQ
jgi:hypothetical protein